MRRAPCGGCARAPHLPIGWQHLKHVSSPTPALVALLVAWLKAGAVSAPPRPQRAVPRAARSASALAGAPAAVSQMPRCLVFRHLVLAASNLSAWPR